MQEFNEIKLQEEEWDFFKKNIRKRKFSINHKRGKTS